MFVAPGSSRTLVSAAFALLLPAGLLAGCNTDSGNALGLNTGEAVALSGVKIDLPPPPSFSDLDQPLAGPDGNPTIFGLRRQMDKFIGKEVTVKAYLLEVYTCPVCPKGQTCRLCEQPHFFLSDKPDGKKEKALMVVDYLAPKQKPPIITVGKQYEVKGTFARNSNTGFAASDGLLQFTRMVDDKNMEFLSPQVALEAKIMAGAEEEKAAYEKAMKMKAALQGRITR